MRSFAFLSVFCFHLKDNFAWNMAAHPWLGALQYAGAFGVPLFFVLSAYLIVELLQRERAATGSIHVPQFYVRRILRIWPVYFALLAVFGVLAVRTHNAALHSPLTWLMYVLFAGNWYVYLFGFPAPPINPFWSVSIEEQFYLVAPWVVRKASRRALALGSVALIAIAYPVAAYLFLRHRPGLVASGISSAWMNSFFQFQFLAAGALLALALRHRVPRIGWPVRVAMLMGGIACWAVCVRVFGVRNDTFCGPGVAAYVAGWLLVLLGAVLLLTSVLGVRAERVPRWLVYLGRISYGMYLFHVAVIDFVAGHRMDGCSARSAAGPPWRRR